MQSLLKRVTPQEWRRWCRSRGEYGSALVLQLLSTATRVDDVTRRCLVGLQVLHLAQGVSFSELNRVYCWTTSLLVCTIAVHTLSARLPHAPSRYQIPQNPEKDWYIEYSIGLKIGRECCSRSSLSFHYVGEELMRRLYHLVYSCPKSPVSLPHVNLLAAVNA